jgi:hypothetical protein
MSEDLDPRRQDSPHGLRQRDVRLLIGVVAVLATNMAVDQPSLVLDRVRERLLYDGALEDAGDRGEAAAVMEDLCQQLRFADGDYGDERPQPMVRAWTHHLSFPDEASARACVAERELRGSLGVATSTGPDGVWVSVTFPDLPPDVGYQQRQAVLMDIAGRHHGRYRGAAGGAGSEGG